jgi:hypothetical protein
MQCTLLIPHLVWPRCAHDDVARDLALPALATLLARAKLERHAALSAEAWLCQAFEVERQNDWPLAPVTLAVDGGEPADVYTLRADPVHIRVGREGLHLVDNALFDLSADEAEPLVAALNAHFAGNGMRFEAPRPKRWYVKLAHAPALSTHPISEAAGADVQHVLPSGADALHWHRLFNEAQMVLHEHPVNTMREARGEPAVNSVWFWGGGTLPRVPGRHFGSVWSDDAGAIALAAAADADHAPVPADAAAWLGNKTDGSAGSGLESHLIVLDALRAPAAYNDAHEWRTRIAELEARWFGPLLAALKTGRVARLTLVALGRDASARFTVTRPDLVKIWRRAKPFAAYI